MVRPLTLLAVAALLFTSACSDSNDAPADTPENAGSSTQTEQSPQTGSSSSTAIAGEEDESSDQDSLILRYNKGEKYRYRATQSSTSVQDSVSATTRSTHIYTKEVLGVNPAGEYMVNMTFTEIKMGMSMKNAFTGAVVMEDEYDSKSKADRDDPVNSQWNYVLNAPVQLLINDRADLRGVEGVRPIIDKIIDSAPNIDQATPQQVASVKQQLEQQITVAMYASMATQEFVAFPDDQLLKGNTWTKSRKSPLGAMFTLSSVTRYEITDISEVNGRQVATVKAEMKGDIEPQPQLSQSGLTVKLLKSDMGGTSTAKMYLDNGVTISKLNKTSSNVSAEVTQSATGETQTVTMKQDSRYEVKLLK